MEGSGYRLWILCGKPQKRQGRTVRRATPLLPVAQRAHTDTDHQGEFALRGAEFPSYDLDLRGTEHRCSRRLHPAPPNAACLPHTRDEFPKRCIFHLNSSRTSCPSVRACPGVKSPCSFFEYTYII